MSEKKNGSIEYCFKHPNKENCWFETKEGDRQRVTSLERVLSSGDRLPVDILRSEHKISMYCESMGGTRCLLQYRGSASCENLWSDEIPTAIFEWATESGSKYRGQLIGFDKKNSWGGFAEPVHYALAVGYTPITV